MKEPKKSDTKIQDHHLPSPQFAALDNLGDGIYILNSNLEYIYENKRGEELSELPKEKFIGKKITELYTDLLATPTGKAIERVKKTKQMEQLEVFYEKVHKWFLITVYPLDGSIAIQVHDISIRKNNEHNLLFLAKASQELSQSLNIDETLKKLAKLTVPEIADWCTIDLLNNKGKLEYFTIAHKDPEKIEWAKKLRSKLPRNSSSGGVEYVLKTGNAQITPLVTDELLKKSIKSEKEYQLIKSIGLNSVMIVPICEGKKPIGAITFITSETRRNYTKADLAMAEDLANRASLAIENARLYKEAQDAIKLRNEFISIASHELKTPVTSIKAYGQVLQRRFMKRGDAESANYLQKMDNQLNRLSALISDLLDVTRIETGKLLLHKDYYDFDDLVKESIDAIERTIPQKIRVKVTTRKKVYGDKFRTGQVLTNLLSNAAKYSPETAHIEVIAEQKKDDVEVCIKDFGIGIPKEKQTMVFDRFYRVSGPQDETYPGLGLGLYISSEIIKRQGGRIWLESEEGKGSTFCFRLPIFIEN